MPITELPADTTLDPLKKPKITTLPADTKLDTPPPQVDMSKGERFIEGQADPLLGIGQLSAHMGIRAPEEYEAMALSGGDLPASAADIDKMVQKREADYQAKRKAAGQTGIDWWRFLGAAGSPVNYVVPAASAETTLGNLALRGLAGTVSAGMEPVVTDDFWSSKGKQAALGTVGGELGGAVASGAGKVIAPALKASQRALADAGVSMTLGQAVGGVGRWTEEMAKSFPILGTFIRNAEGRNVDSFNRSVLNQTLEPIGEKLPPNIQVGHDAISHVADAYSAAYDDLLGQVTFESTPQFAHGMDNITKLSKELPEAQAKQFDTLMENRLYNRLGTDGQMDGQTMKQVESELRSFSSSYRGSSDPAQRDLGRAVDQVRRLVRKTLRDNYAAIDPEIATRLDNIDNGYAMLVRVEDAASRRLSNSGGVFTPLDLLAASKKGDTSARDRAFSHGDALFQKFAKAAQEVLPSKRPDSGTAERTASRHLITDLLATGAGAGGAYFNPVVAKTLAAVAPSVLPYTRVGQRVVDQYFQPGQLRRMLGSGLEATDPYLASILGIGMGGRQ